MSWHPNSLLHSGSEIRVTLRADGKLWVRIELRDETPYVPVPVAFSDDATSGRGLSMVVAVCRNWGVDRQGDAKTVWAELAVGDARPFEPCRLDVHSNATAVIPTRPLR